MTEEVAPVAEPVPEKERGINVTIDNAYRADWEVEPDFDELGLLYNHIHESVEHDAYYIGGMVLLTKKQALIAVNSLGREALEAEDY